MARTVLPIVGAVVGAYFGNPALGYAIGAGIAGVVDPINVKGPRIGDTGAQTSSEGAFRAIVYGTCQVTGNVIASGPLIKRDVKESQGKGGGTSSTEHAYRTYAVRVCEGPVVAFLRVWQDDKLVYDMRTTSTMVEESIKWAANKAFYLGGEDQLPDPSLQMIFGVDETPAHRGSAYLVAIEEDLTDRRGSIPQYRFEVSGTAALQPVVRPLAVFDWVNEPNTRPTNDGGQTIYTVAGQEIIDDYDAAVELLATYSAVGTPAAASSRTFIAYANSSVGIPSGFDGGDSVITNPEKVYYHLALEMPDVWDNPVSASGFLFCSHLQLLGATPDDHVSYALWEGGPPRQIYLAQLRSTGVTDPSDPWAGPGNNCINYPAGTVAVSNPVLRMEVKRRPSVPSAGWVRVAGIAKQLCAIEYRSGLLYQNALGPMLLPGDPDYDNAAFWDAARTAAILSGDLKEDVSTPVEVSEYASGFSAGVGEPVTLADIVSDIHERCDFPSGKFEVSGLDDMVSGLVLAGDYAGADAINTLRGLYLFDHTEYDKKIHYPKRGAAVVHTLTIDDLVEEPDTSKREQAIEFPKKLHLSYQNAVGGYAVAKATSSRSSPDVRVVGEGTTQVPVVLSPDQAAQAAAILHAISWQEARGEVKLSVPLSFIKYVASNCFGLALRGSVSRLRLEEINCADGVIEYTLRYDRQSAYTSEVTGIPIAPATPPPPTIVGESVLVVLDISPRTDSEDDLNILYAVSGGLPAWVGATVQRSLDGGANYTSVIDINRGQVLGSLINPLAAASEFYTDTTNVVRVQLYRDTQTIESITDSQLLSEGGAFAVQRPDGSWEVLQYRDADEVSAGIYDLSYLHRGQLNSGASAHLAGALFVMLADAAKAPAQSAWIGTDLTHRAVSYGESPESADEQTAPYLGKSQTEWPIAYLTLTRSSPNVMATWTPRHRLGTEDVPVASANFRGYRVTLDDGVLPPVTFDTTDEGFTRDVSALGAPLTVTVSALNRYTGAGPATSGAI